MNATLVLVALCLVTLGLCAAFVLGPLLWTRRTSRGGASTPKGSGSWIVFFAAIGAAFMLVELSQMQRLILFLGPPSYGLAVVLSTLLVASGIGSLLVGKLDRPERALGYLLPALLLVLLATGAGGAELLRATEGASTPGRVVVAVSLLLPMGLLMGTPLPLGLRIASKGDAAGLTPWPWGINGAASVNATVLSTGISLAWGISRAFWAGALFYGLALIAFSWMRFRRRTARTHSGAA